jgi:hypothetical protein
MSKVNDGIYGGANSAAPKNPFGQTKVYNAGVSIDQFISKDDARRAPSAMKFFRDSNGRLTLDPSKGSPVNPQSMEEVAEMLLASRPQRYHEFYLEALRIVTGVIGYTNTSDMDNALFRFMSEEPNAQDSYRGQDHGQMYHVVQEAAHLMAIDMIKRYESRILEGQFLQI